MPPIVLVSGSPSASSKSSFLLGLVLQQLKERGQAGALISVRDFPAQDLLEAKYDSPVFDAAKKLIAESAGVVVATPVYKAAYSGSLKTFLDILPQYAFRGKTLLPLATGGSPGHLLAIDYALKPVLSALAATDVLQGVYAVDTHFKLEADGKLTLSAEILQRLTDSVDQLVTNIHARNPARKA
jgi:FMN reductase